MRTKENLLFHTLIGLRVAVVQSSQRALGGVEGTIVDETKNLLVLERTGGREVKIPKIGCILRFSLEDGSSLQVEGRKIAFRPEERAKKLQ